MPNKCTGEKDLNVKAMSVKIFWSLLQIVDSGFLRKTPPYKFCLRANAFTFFAVRNMHLEYRHIYSSYSAIYFYLTTRKYCQRSYCNNSPYTDTITLIEQENWEEQSRSSVTCNLRLDKLMVVYISPLKK